MGFEPIKRTAVNHLQARLGARFERRHGWEIAAGYGDAAAERAAGRDGVALADVSWLGKLECKGEWAESLAGQAVPGAVFYALIPSHGIWIVRPEAVDAAREALEALRAGRARSYLIDMSSAYASFELRGPRAPGVLCKLSAARVAAGGHAQAPVAGVPCLVIRNGLGFQLHFTRDFGEYVWECLLDAGAEFGIRPAGIEAVG